MNKETVDVVGGRAVIVMDSISMVSEDERDKIVVSGSHGGRSSGELAQRVPLSAVFFNDAGVGKNHAGIAALAMLERRGIPAGAISHVTARIGDARDHWEEGVLTHVNAPACRLGLNAGGRLAEEIRAAFGG